MAPSVKARPDLHDGEMSLSLGWKENPSAKRLLDTIVSILTEEYIQKVKENPEIFSK